jgi:peptide chain release factor 2
VVVMLFDELQEQLRNAQTDVAAIRSFWQQTKIDEKFAELDIKVNDPDFWKHPERDAILAEHRKLKVMVEDYHAIDKDYGDCSELIEIFKNNEAELANLAKDIATLCSKIAHFKLNLLLSEENDAKNCYLSINAGAGGTESQDWAQILLRMYLRFCERENFNVSVLDCQSGEAAGIKSATLYIKGLNTFGLLKTENGIHRLVRISPFDANKRRHTSFAAVTVIHETEDEKIDINETDLRIDTFRAGGAGGQHVNKTESAIRITHLPSGIVVQCQNERSQIQNRQVALKMLKARLIQKQEEEKKAREDAKEKKKIEWGSQIRSYVLHPYKMVKDHRTDFESPRPDDVLDGDLMPFIEKTLLATAQQKNT